MVFTQVIFLLTLLLLFFFIGKGLDLIFEEETSLSEKFLYILPIIIYYPIQYQIASLTIYQNTIGEFYNLYSMPFIGVITFILEIFGPILIIWIVLYLNKNSLINRKNKSNYFSFIFLLVLSIVFFLYWYFKFFN